MPRLARLLTLPPRRWWGLVWAYWLLLKAHSRTKRGADINRLPVGTRPKAGRARGLTRVQNRIVSDAVWCVETASRYPIPWARCLQRSLALFWWLKSRGIGAELHIGVRKEGDQLTAHAWLEYQGIVLNDRQDVAAAFTPLAPMLEMQGHDAVP